MYIKGYHNEPQPPVKPITCPRCGSKEIAFVAEYHKAWTIEIAKFVCIGIIFTTIIMNFSTLITSNADKTTMDDIKGIIFIFTIMTISLQCIQKFIEHKTHIQCICRDCGKHWLHN